MASSLILHGKVTTTTARAKALRPLVEQWVTAGRKTARANGATKLALYRSLVAEIHQLPIVKKLIDDVVPRVGDRPGGYTRIYKLGNRHGDAAPQSMITFVDKAPIIPATKASSAKATTKTTEKPVTTAKTKATA